MGDHQAQEGRDRPGARQDVPKYIKEITIAARQGGATRDTNPRLRTAIGAASR